jgi:hypothetical protein
MPVEAGAKSDLGSFLPGARISRADFMWCLMAAQRGHDIEEIAARLMEESTKAKENGARARSFAFSPCAIRAHGFPFLRLATEPSSGCGGVRLLFTRLDGRRRDLGSSAAR